MITKQCLEAAKAANTGKKRAFSEEHRLHLSIAAKNRINSIFDCFFIIFYCKYNKIERNNLNNIMLPPFKNSIFEINNENDFNELAIRVFQYQYQHCYYQSLNNWQRESNVV